MTSGGTEPNIVLEVRQALLLAVLFNGLGSFYACAVGLQIAPWRSALVGLITGMALLLALQTIGSYQAFASSLILLVPVVLAVTVELWHHRTFVKGGSLVVRRGVLGNLYESLPISEVRDVQVTRPLLGQLWNVGDLNVAGYGWATTLPAVRRPEDCARRLIALRDASAVRRGGKRAISTG